jgi:hypothetical protein
VSIHPDADSAVARLAGPLAPDVRPAFYQAAQAALAQIACPGEGVIYRTLKPIQRAYFSAPSDLRAQWDIAFERPGVSKLIAKPALEYVGDQRHVRYRHPKAGG